jgi:CheY-like chemotaxis protein
VFPHHEAQVTNKLLSGRRVLVVEDEVMILMMIEDMLSDLGCTAVVAAATISKALALVAEQEFDAAMLDLNLNGNSTYEVADALAARGVPFFFSTGNNLHGIREEYRDLLVLRKPFTGDDLARVFTQLFSG